LKLLFLILQALILIPNIVLGQKEATINEVLNYWTKYIIPAENEMDCFTKFDNEFSDKIKKNIDSLRNQNIDSIIIYSVLYTGCSNIFWKINGNVFLKKIINRCDAKTIKIKSTTIFDYYTTYQNEIKHETIMPMLYYAIIINDSTITCASFEEEGETQYLIISLFGVDFNQYYFTENAIDNIESMFYNHNRELKTYKWFQLLDDQIKN